jgi:hypothetical protein
MNESGLLKDFRTWGVIARILLYAEASSWPYQEWDTRREIVRALWVKPTLRDERIGIFEVLGAARRDVPMDTDDCLGGKVSLYPYTHRRLRRNLLHRERSVHR